VTEKDRISRRFLEEKGGPEKSAGSGDPTRGAAWLVAGCLCENRRRPKATTTKDSLGKGDEQRGL